MTPASAFSIGDTLASRYRLDATLGRGAMGEVFRGHDLELHRDVAVKLLADVESGEESRLLNEARAAASLNHPGLVAIYDVGRQGGAPFLVMELVAGANLRADPPRNFDGIARMALQILAALEHAHAQGIVHRDLKPENILVADAAGAVQYKVADFGLALSARSSRETHAGMIVGTAAYLAPEQALGRAVDGRADLYALGVVLYELVAGRPPFEGGDLLTIISQHVHAPVTPPRTYRPDVPPPLERAILRLLAKDPAQRYESAGAVADAITAVLAAMSVADATATVAMPAVPDTTTGLLDQLVRGRLVGRSAELAQLRSMWERALAGHGHLALVSGEPGSGKTRLARELIVQAQVAGAVVLRGGCYEYEATTPYLPFVEALRLWVNAEPDATLRELAGDGAAELAKLAPELGVRLGPFPAAAPLAAHEERLRLFDHVARFMQRLAERRGLLLFADDLQWADQGTLALLHYLLRHLGTHRFLALGAYREIELDRRHPLAAALVDWNRERLATRIALGRLTREHTERMLAVLLGQETVTEEFARAIFGETEGNPFFVEEVVKALIDQGQIYRGDGEWQRGDVAQLSIPQSVKSAIGHRLDRLGEACTDVLRTAAALGKVFEFEELAACTGTPENQLLDALDEALAAQLVAPEGVHFAFTHDKIREVLYEEMNPVRRRRLHQRIGEGLEKMHAARIEAHAQDLAHHFAESGDVERGLRYSLQAAEAARKVFAFDEALLFYQRARECAEALGQTAEIGGIELAMGDALDASGRSAEAAAHLERARELTGDAIHQVELAARIAQLYIEVGNNRGEQFAELALREATPDRFPIAYARAAAARARSAHMRGQHMEAVEAFEKAQAVAEKHGAHALLSRIYGYLAGACQHLARFDDSDGWARRIVAMGRERGDAAMEASGFEFQAENASGRGHWREAIAHANAELALATRVHAEDRKAWANLPLGWALFGLGQLEEAERVLRDDLELCRRIGEPRLATFIQTVLVLVFVDRGDDDEAVAMLAEATRESDRMNLSYVRTLACQCRAYRACGRGEWEEVLAEYERARQIREGTDARLNEMYFAELTTRALIGLGRMDEARARLDHGRELATASGCDSALALLLQQESVWHARRDEAGEARRAVDQAIAEMDRWESAISAARARMDRAALRRGQGDVEGAREDAKRACETFTARGARPDTERARAFLEGLG